MAPRGQPLDRMTADFHHRRVDTAFGRVRRAEHFGGRGERAAPDHRLDLPRARVQRSSPEALRRS
jgi:hypothetical protein